MKLHRNVQRVKYACYISNITMSAVGNLSPLLFLTFRQTYGISFTLLGLLVAINFTTQLVIDLIFSFFSHKFNISKTVKIMPVLAVVGFLVYGASPFLFSQENLYLGLAIGTVIFSAASGLAEVLLSPIFAALPSENPDRDMSKLHSVYAWGVVAVVVIVTLFLLFFRDYWFVLAFTFALIPFVAAVLFFGAEIPKMETPKETAGALRYFKDGRLWLCVVGIFLGGASECTMAQWASGYLEGALGIDKVWGDVFGVAMFALTLGIGRTWYAKKGKNIRNVLLLCAIGATACYLIAVLVPVPFVGLLACALTGFCTSMLWPGSLVVASENFPSSGVFIYAMMAAGGDLGASVGPQLVGAIADGVAASPAFVALAETLAITAEQLGLKIGLLCGGLFPMIAIAVFLAHIRLWKKQSGEKFCEFPEK
jgi:MFS family permease